jgi:hypothetical protein
VYSMDNNLTEKQNQFIKNILSQLRKKKLKRASYSYLIDVTTKMKNVVEAIEIAIIALSMFLISVGFFGVFNIIPNMHWILNILFISVGLISSIFVYHIGKIIYSFILKKSNNYVKAEIMSIEKKYSKIKKVD